MIIKKYEGTTENEAMLKVREELGNEAIIMNIKTTRPKGIFRFFRKTLVEVTAALDEKTPDVKVKTEQESAKNATKIIEEAIRRQNDVKEAKKKEESEALEKKLDTLTGMIEKQIETEKEVEVLQETKTEASENEDSNSRNKRIRDLLYNQFISNEVN